MGIEKQGSKGAHYVGGLLNLFDWNAKSRKKLFSSKGDLPDKSKQKKTLDGNLPTTRLQVMLDEDDNGAGSSMKESSDYSYASSLTDDDFYKAPSVVARLMGLDSLPISNILEPNSTPLSDCQSFKSSHYKAKSLEYFQDPQTMHSEAQFTELKSQRAVKKPIKKFQTEILPPKSAKSVPVTRHKLLSPIKSSNFTPRNNAAQIIEAAARIIEQRPDMRVKTTVPMSKSSALPLKVNGSKKTAQKPSKSNAGKHLKGHYMDKSWNGSVDSEESSVGAKSKGKSVSLALQAKANVQKREAFSNSRKETSEINPNRVFTTQSNTLKKQNTQKGTNVLQQNNQKQNCAFNKTKLHLKSELQNGKALNGEISSARQRNGSKLTGPSKAGSKKLGLDVIKDDKRRVTRKKKRPIDAHNLSKGKNGEVNDSSGVTDVVSFTFTGPMTRPGPGLEGPTEAGEKCRIILADSPSKRMLIDSDGVGHNVKRSDNTLSTFLEHKLKELNHKIEFSQQRNGTVSFMSSKMVGEKDEYYTDDTKGQPVSSLYSFGDLKGLKTDQKCQGQLEEMGTCVNVFSNRTILDFRLTSPVSVLDQFSITESCNSSDTAESNSTGGGNKHSSLIQFEADTVLSDSPSSNTTSPHRKKPINWELEYIVELLRSINLTMFNDYALGKGSDLINPHLFNQLETRKKYSNACKNISRINTRLVFDCVNECLDLRCRRCVIGGYKLWAKGVRVVKRKDKLAEDVYKQISSWGAMGHCMVDEIVNDDMSSKNGRWLDYDIEAFELGVQIESRVLNSLIDEVVDDILVL